MRNKATHRNRSGYQPYHDVLAFLEEALPSTPVFAADGNASVFDNWLDPSASVSKVMDLTAEQFQFVRALYVALPPVSRTLPPGDHAVMASSGGSVMLALVADGQACARFLAPDFIQAMLIQVGQRVTVGLGTPL